MEKQRLLFETVFKRKLTDAGTENWLQQITAEHPYFSLAQYYLLQLTTPGTTDFSEQARKTNALFNNAYWLNFKLQEAKGPDTISAAIIEEPIPPAFTATTTAPAVEMIAIEESIVSAIHKEETIHHPAEEAVITNVAADEVKQEEIAVTEVPVIETATVINTEAVIVDETTAAEAPAVESSIVEAAPMPAEPPVEIPADETTIEPAAETNKTDTIDPDISTAAAAPVAEETVLFEPLHTTDYFASVGIKLSEEEKSSDKLGKQLRSFTEWLKTMKRVHSSQMAASSGAVQPETVANDTQIQKLAEQSNKEGDVLTEAMAEVLLQQGRRDKAIEILEKLSLLNPGKSPYFAAKIHQIKGN